MRKIWVIVWILLLVVSTTLYFTLEIYEDTCKHKDINTVWDTENSDNTIYLCRDCGERVAPDRVQFRREIDSTTKILWGMLIGGAIMFGVVDVCIQAYGSTRTLKRKDVNHGS